MTPTSSEEIGGSTITVPVIVANDSHHKMALHSTPIGFSTTFQPPVQPMPNGSYVASAGLPPLPSSATGRMTLPATPNPSRMHHQHCHLPSTTHIYYHHSSRRQPQQTHEVLGLLGSELGPHLKRNNTMPVHRGSIGGMLPSLSAGSPCNRSTANFPAELSSGVRAQSHTASTENTNSSVAVELNHSEGVTGMTDSRMKNSATRGSFGENLQLDLPFIDSISRSTSYEEKCSNAGGTTNGLASGVSGLKPSSFISTSTLSFLSDVPTSQLSNVSGGWGMSGGFK